MAEFHYNRRTKIFFPLQLYGSLILFYFFKAVSLCVTSKAVVSLARPPLLSFLLPSSLSPSSFIQVVACIEFLSRRSHKLPATLGLNSKEMSIKSRLNGRSSA